MNSDKINIMEVPPFIRVKDAITYFGIGERQAWNLLAQKKIVGSKGGSNLWVIDSASVIKYLKKYKNVHKEEEHV